MTQPVMTDSEVGDCFGARCTVKLNEYEAIDSLNSTAIAFSKM
jgi:hypothetical protein